MTALRAACRALAAAGLFAAAASLGTGAVAADMTVRQVTEALVKATAEAPADFSGKNLAGLDLSDLDFHGANLAGADLSATDLSDADFSRSNLAGVRLDRAVVIHTNFTGANLARASLMFLGTSTGLDVRDGEGPNFAGADLSETRIYARLSRSDLHGARLVNARLGADLRTPQTIIVFRTELSGCNLAGADLAGADLSGALLSFADLSGAALTGTDLERADLSHANLTQADLTAAILTRADLDEAILRGVRGLERTVGLDAAKNRDRTVE
jgi:uncharacterized protein YjbI with pentapeptide repeats